MSELGELLLGAEVGLLVGGFLFASFSDLRTREVSDGLWQGLGVAGLVLGAVGIASGGAVPLALWVLVGLLALQHMFAWDVKLGPVGERYADLIELALYIAVIGVVATAAARVGIGASGVPYAVIALLVTIVFARGLFELGVLYGGADAKALMVGGLLVPTFASALYVPSLSAATIDAVVPFSINFLMDAALASLAIPIALAARNVARGEFSFPRGFTGYALAVRELPDRFVWVRDPAVGPVRKEEEAVETAEEDRQRRSQMAKDLLAKGMDRVWVTPQIPFLVLMTVGVIAALIAGNLVIDLLALL